MNYSYYYPYYPYYYSPYYSYRHCTSTLCWCGKPLSTASRITYLNGNLPCCDLCLMKANRTVEEDKAWEFLDKIQKQEDTPVEYSKIVDKYFDELASE